MRIVIIEGADRFARELMVQEIGIALLTLRGVRLLTAPGDDPAASDDPRFHQLSNEVCTT